MHLKRIKPEKLVILLWSLIFFQSCMYMKKWEKHIYFWHMFGRFFTILCPQQVKSQLLCKSKPESPHITFFLYPVLPVPPLSPPKALGRRADVPYRGDPSPCKMSLLRPDCCGASPPAFPLHPPQPCVLLEGAGGGRGPVQGEERVEEMVVGWDRGRERDNPALGPGWQMTPACRPNVPVGLSVVGAEIEDGWQVGMCGQLGRAEICFDLSCQTGEQGDGPSGKRSW